MHTNKVKADVAVIGAGPGGGAAALCASEAGLKTVLVDSREIGGTCLNRGCVPSKAWLSAEHLYRMGAFAKKLSSEISKPDFVEIKKHQREVVELMRKGLVSLYKKGGVQVINGKARFLSERAIEVNGGETEIEFSKAVIATGSNPLNIFQPGPGLYDSDSVFQMETLPRSLSIVGGGAIGMEMATFFSGMGADVTVIEALDEILPLEDADICATVKRELKRSGVKFHTGAAVEKAESIGSGGWKLELAGGLSVESDAVLVAVGRRPATESLNLESASIKTDVRGYISVDHEMSTSREGIYAVGDVAGKSLLAYTAHHEGVIAARNIAGGRGRMDYRYVPSIVFSNPEIGSVGRTEKELSQTGVHYKKGVHFIRALARAHAGGEISGVVKVLAGEKGEILGIHMAGPGATEVIHSAVVAMTAGMSVKELSEVMFGHPTISEAIPIAASQIAF